MACLFFSHRVFLTLRYGCDLNWLSLLRPSLIPFHSWLMIRLLLLTLWSPGIAPHALSSPNLPPHPLLPPLLLDDFVALLNRSVLCFFPYLRLWQASDLCTFPGVLLLRETFSNTNPSQRIVSLEDTLFKKQTATAISLAPGFGISILPNDEEILTYSRTSFPLFRAKTKGYASLRSNEPTVNLYCIICYPGTDERWLKAPSAQAFDLEILISEGGDMDVWEIQTVMELDGML